MDQSRNRMLSCEVAQIGSSINGIAPASQAQCEVGPDKVMTTKDYIYLGMILLTALAFYCNGFYAGVYRCKRMYDSLLDDAETEESAQEMEPQGGKSLATNEKIIAFHPTARTSEILTSKRDFGGDFGKN